MRLLDSCICVDFMRGRLPDLYALMRESDPRLFKVPAIVEAELRVGAEKSVDVRRARWLVDEFLAPFEIVPFDSACACHYGHIRVELERRGQKIGKNDLLIAATAVAHGAVLVTNNVKEFQRVPGLSLESWQVVDWGESCD